MRKLSLSILAAGAALVAVPAFAQAGHSGPRPSGHGPNVMVRHGGPNVMARHGRPNVMVRHGRPNVMFRHGGRFGRPGVHPGRNFRHHRLNRGFFIHPFWFGPQFHINNWQMYGFADPGDGRWVRYYDDAYLIGSDGRVEDTRYGMDWDRYGEEWELDDGIPAYRGSRDWRPDGDDYEWAERHERREDHGEHRGHHGPMMGGPGHAPGHGYGYGAAYGGYYGYGAYAYPIVIETVTTQGCGCSYEVVEEVVEVRQRHRRRPPVRRPPPPRRPPPGERG